MDTWQKLKQKHTSRLYITAYNSGYSRVAACYKQGASLLRLLDGGLHPEQHEPDGDADEYEAVHDGGDLEDLRGGVHLRPERAPAALLASGVERRHDLGEGVVGGLAHAEHGHLVEPLEPAVRVHALDVGDAAGPLLRRRRQRRDRCHGERRHLRSLEPAVSHKAGENCVNVQRRREHEELDDGSVALAQRLITFFCGARACVEVA
jgi:hypothetical protein